MTSTITPSTSRATFAIGDERTARRVVDLLNESLDDDQAAVAAFERPDGRWDISMHFAEPPDQASIRELVSLAAGDDVAQAITFDTVEAKDWVKASLEDLVPVPAGRFIVHGRHDRARVPPNKLGIEIEAALAFGTGHHGTTRGCLLLLDQVLRSRDAEARARSRHRHRRARDRRGQGAAAARAGERHRSGQRRASRATMRGSMASAIWWKRSARPDFPRRNSQSAGRSIWCWRISSPIRCGKWRRRWRRIWRHRRW